MRRNRATHERPLQEAHRARPPAGWLGVLVVSGLLVSCGDNGSAGTGGGSTTTTTGTGDPGVWIVERADVQSPGDPLPLRQSLGNISRPFVKSPSFDVELHAQSGSFLEFELGYQGAAPRAEPPGKISVSVRDGARTTPLTVESLGNDGGTTPWHRYRVDLSSAPSGSVELVFRTQDDPKPPAGEGWRMSRPRLYQERNETGRPNVLVITVDTLRADYLGFYGHDRTTSPRLDEFASTATVFVRAISQGSWTLPSYSSMFTALYPESHGVVHRPHRLDGKFEALAEIFADAGYTTGAFVTGTFTDSEWGFDQGFDSYDDFGMVTDDNGTDVADPTANESMVAAEQRITSPEVTDKAIAWLEHNADRSFFLMVHYFDPHSDLVEHPGYTERFPERPADFRMKLAQGEMPAEVARKRALYEGEIAFTDHHIGRLLDHLDRTGLAEHTVVVLCADHGEEYYERTKIGHGHALWNELLHVPLVMRAPGIDASRVAAPVANVDVMPTLAELCDVPFTAPDHGGESLVPLMTGEVATREDPVLSVRFPGVSRTGQDRDPWNWYRVDQGDETYIWLRQGRQVIQFLFDNKTDPEHRRDLAKERPEQVQQFQQYRARVLPRLEAIRAAIGKSVSVSDIESMQATLEGLGYVGEEDEVELPTGDPDDG